MTRNKIFKWMISLAFLLIGIIGLLLLQTLIFPSNQKIMLNAENTLQHTPKHFETEAVIAGIGDILIHDTVYNEALTVDDQYNFDHLFKPVYSLLNKPDFLIANQESIPGGTELGISSYPSFNSPHEIVDALMNAGVDMVTTANNHMLDKGENGILSAIGYYEEKDLPYTGTFKSPEDKNTIRIANVNGIKLAVLAYSYGTNGVPIPADKDYLVSMLEPKQVLQDIDKAKEESDIVLLALHWGDEYARTPNQTQKELAHQFIEAGADIIFGHHPHVLQPIEWIDKPNGEKGLVVYSLGNFISGQKTENPYKDLGGMIEVSLRKKIDGKGSYTKIKDVDFHPTYTSSTQFKNYRVYPIDDAKKEGFTHYTRRDLKQFMFPK
ncbi:poly-gamma-glutamate synthesis protein (capsule biosynthesis protein) [Lederbergia galactosidilyticus]|uniref:CapA family protein n=1 Tax=Lederbergia galactosidilytica TaxID=217031 RepID=UPI000A4D7491|nr:CapA family protein [Lederbergia galactosidilytica]MBP1913534.1 poly-gamma-glutamate synthesis protein (capsule biosynthesis protein) [Lederbergia galactosidilytica]